MKLFQITACDRNCMSLWNFYDKKRITITSSKTFFKNVLKMIFRGVQRRHRNLSKKGT